MKRAMTGQLALLPAIKRIMDEVMEPQLTSEDFEGPLAAERRMLGNARKMTLFAAGSASQKYIQNLQDQQEIMGALADCITEVYAFESCLLRSEKSGPGARNTIAMTKLYAARAMQTIEACARKVIAAVAEGDMLRTHMAILRRFAKYEPADTIALGRQVARHALGL
jgi:butyryl-CoA dehydrogenase